MALTPGFEIGESWVLSFSTLEEFILQQQKGHFTVISENEPGVDLVLIQSFLLYYVNYVVLMQTSTF